MTEIQKAFEKFVRENNLSTYSLERWNDAWQMPNTGKRYYASAVTEASFELFLSGWLIALNRQSELREIKAND